MNAPGAPQPGLVLTGVGHRFGRVVAVDEVHLEARPGEVHCLLGPSGSGKSTLLRLIAGLETLQRGSISIGGRPMNREPPEERAVGFVFQDYALFPHLDARSNVAFGMRRGKRRERWRTAEAWLDRVGLADFAKAMPHTLSGGQQQRVALARALAREPDVMLLDEPFSGLDEQLRAAVRRTTLALLRETGVATLMITHDPQEALLIGDRVSVIRRGRVLQTGKPAEVYDHSANRRVAEIFGPVNSFKSTAQDGRAPSPWGRLDASTIGDGEVEILIRPHALILSREAKSAAAAARGTIVEVATAGALATITIELSGQVIEAQDLARGGWRVGETVDVTLAQDAAMVRPGDPRPAGDRLG